MPPRSDAFGLPRNASVLVCTRVAEGAPVLLVSHDEDGDWQFLCDGDHSDERHPGDQPQLVCLEHVLEKDASLLALADLCPDWSARRAGPGEPWLRQDHYEDRIHERVAEFGWAVTMVAQGESGEPPCAYTTGLFRTLQHPELIIVGLSQETMGSILNACGSLARKRCGRLPLNEPVDGVLEAFPVKLREVRSRESYRLHVGYSLWFHGGLEFPLWQVLWPDCNGVFPDEAGVDPDVASLQPSLP